MTKRKEDNNNNDDNQIEKKGIKEWEREKK